jgi:hypothetical protein
MSWETWVSRWPRFWLAASRKPARRAFGATAGRAVGHAQTFGGPAQPGACAGRATTARPGKPPR